MAIDQNAMYKAGFSSKSTGRNTENDAQARKQEFWKGVGNQAYSILGNAAIGQVKKNYKSLQVFANAFNSTAGQTALTIAEGLPNPGLKEDLSALSGLHRKANRKAHTSFGKARSKAAQEAAGYRQQLTDMKSWLDAAKKQRVDVQGMTAVAAGLTQAGGEQASFSSGASEYAVGNSYALAEGSLLQRGRWNYDATKGPIGPTISVGGEWKNDKVTGKNSYVNKAETGTYEEYAAEHESMRGGMNVDDAVNFGDADSREQWTKLNQDNRGIVSQVPWSNLKFAEKEDKTTGDNLREYEKLKIKQASSKGSLSWENVEANEKEEFQAKMNEYTDLQFRDYFFGGGTYEASATRMAKSAPAYQFLMEEDRVADEKRKAGHKSYKDAGAIFDEDGNYNKGFGPGTENWAGRILSLRGQSFVSGSQYRKTTAEQQWKKIGEKYTRNRGLSVARQIEESNRTSNLNKSKYYSISLQEGAGASSVAKSQIDPLVNAFNNATDKSIIPQQTASHIGMQWGKDASGFYVMTPKYTDDAQGRKVQQGFEMQRGTKDQIASVLRITDPQLGYNFAEPVVQLWTPDDIEVDSKKDDWVPEPSSPFAKVEYIKDSYKPGDGGKYDNISDALVGFTKVYKSRNPKATQKQITAAVKAERTKMENAK